MNKSRKYLLEKGMPDGWDQDTIKSISKKIGVAPDERGFFDACVSRMGKHMDKDTAKGLCANIKDTSLHSTHWRNKPHDKAMKDVKNKKNVKD